MPVACMRKFWSLLSSKLTRDVLRARKAHLARPRNFSTIRAAKTAAGLVAKAGLTAKATMAGLAAVPVAVAAVPVAVAPGMNVAADM